MPGLGKMLFYKIRSEENLNRFYDITLNADLFGISVVERHWGRIGATGQRIRKSFQNTNAAKNEFDRLCAIRTRRGYVLEGESAGTSQERLQE